MPVNNLPYLCNIRVIFGSLEVYRGIFELFGNPRIFFGVHANLRNVFRGLIVGNARGDFGSSRIIFGEYPAFGKSSGTKNRLKKIPAEFRIPGFPAYRLEGI